jgi:carboxylate-amine ligase
MVEMTTLPSADFVALAASYVQNLRLAMEVGRELGLRLYPLGTYPLPTMLALRHDLRYQLQALTIGRERFAYASRCAGTHLHLEAPPGTVWPDPKVAREAPAAAREEMVGLYNLATALDPALVAITRSCPFYEGRLEGIAARTARYRGDFGVDGVYAGLPQVGALQPSARDAEDLISREGERYRAWYRAMDGAGADRRLYARAAGDRHRASWNPVRLNPAGTVEIRSMDANQPEATLAACATAIAAAERVRGEDLHVVPSPESRGFEVKDGELLVPGFDYLAGSLLPAAVRDGAGDPDVAAYLDSLVDFALPYSEGSWSVARLRQPSGATRRRRRRSCGGGIPARPCSPARRGSSWSGRPATSWKAGSRCSAGAFVPRKTAGSTSACTRLRRSTRRYWRWCGRSWARRTSCRARRVLKVPARVELHPPDSGLGRSLG